MLKHSVALRVWLGHPAAPDRLRAIVEEHRARAEEMLADPDALAGSPAPAQGDADPASASRKRAT